MVNIHHSSSDSERDINAKFKLDINKLSVNKHAEFLDNILVTGKISE
jgi:hypothetical protein